jgi:hypothetical protein
MKIQIISSTDNKFLGKIIEDSFPLQLDEEHIFTPDGKMQIGGKITRYYSSNYSIDVQEYVEQI